jgi:putative two-component system response regulator
MNRTVLIVDDQEHNRDLLRELLSKESLRLVTAVDGEQAIEQIAKAPPDLVLLDVQMPKLNGFEVCRLIKTSPQTRLIPVVLVTALSAREDRVLGLVAGADDFLSKPIDPTELLVRVRSLLNVKTYTDELERAETVLFSMARIVEGRDRATGDHCERLSSLCAELGREIGLSEDQVTALSRAGIVHDVGKIAVPDAVLLKPAKLTAKEWKIMRQHPVVGERICAPLKLFRLVLPIIRHHHEKMNGSGYPDGLTGNRIPITARVLQVVDVFDALTRNRPYRRALTKRKALAIMKEEVAKGWWDDNIVSAFGKMIDAKGRNSS